MWCGHSQRADGLRPPAALAAQCVVVSADERLFLRLDLDEVLGRQRTKGQRCEGPTYIE